MKGVFLKVLWLFAVATVSASVSAELSVQEAYVRGLPPGQKVTAAFMRLENTGASDVRLTGASTEAAGRVEIHRHLHRDGRMSMQEVESVDIASGADFVFAPGGYHLMLIGLKQPLGGDDKVAITLYFEDGREQTLSLPVISVLDEAR